MMVGQAKAQEVANEIKRISKAVVDDPKQDVQVRRVAYFKVNAVDYMKMKIRDIVAGNPKDKEAINKNIKMVNEQAYAMYEFVNLYIKQLAEAKTPESKDLVGKEFRAAPSDIAPQHLPFLLRFFPEIVGVAVADAGFFSVRFQLQTEKRKFLSAFFSGKKRQHSEGCLLLHQAGSDSSAVWLGAPSVHQCSRCRLWQGCQFPHRQ